MTTSGDGGHYEAQEAAREIRETVADQLHDLVVERSDLGSLDEIVNRVRQVGRVHQQVIQARGRQVQAAEHGLACAPHEKAEREALEMLRASVLSLGEACGSVAVGLDVEQQRRRVGTGA